MVPEDNCSHTGHLGDDANYKNGVAPVQLDAQLDANWISIESGLAGLRAAAWQISNYRRPYPQHLTGQHRFCVVSAPCAAYDSI